MVKLSTILAALIDADGTYDQIMAVTLAFEEEDEKDNPLEARRASDRERGRRWRERLNLPASEWEALKGEVLRRDGFICQYCGTREDVMHVDHVVPLIKGGTNDLTNLVCACAACNGGKSGRTPGEWRNQ